MPSLTSKKNFQYTPKPLKLTIPKLKKMYETGILEPDLRIELINGKPIMMAPIGFKHIKVVNKLNEYLYKLIFQRKLDYIVSVQNPVKITNNNLLYPDIAIFPRSIYDKNDIPKVKNSILIIEVSDTTLKYDKEIKLPIYAKGKAKEVLIIDLKNETVEKYSNPSKNLFKDIHIYQKDDEINIFGNVFKLIDIL